MKTSLQRTVVAFLLDRTGSMQSCKAATIEAFNGYLEGLKQGPESKLIEFTFLQFDSQSLDKICVAEELGNVRPLDDATYQPRASTPLIDAAYKTIKAVEAALAKREDEPKVVICIQTDGFENASTEYTMPQLNVLIKEKVKSGWQFVFMGAGIDAYAQSGQMGIAAVSTASYNRESPRAARAAFAAMAENTREFSSGRRMHAEFDMRQRVASGDAYADHYLNADGTAKNAPPDPASAKAQPLPPVPPRPISRPGTAPAVVDDFTL